MDKSFFLVLLHVLGGLSVIIQLFLPIFIKAVAHYDMNRRKFAFSVYLFGFIKIIGGYIATYNGGLAVHLSRKSAVLFPYSKMHSERTRFSFIKTVHFILEFLFTFNLLFVCIGIGEVLKVAELNSL